MTTAPRLSKKGMQVMIYLQPEQKQKLALLGGSKFLQAAIDEAFDEYKTDYSFIYESVSNPAFSGKIWVVVDLQEADFVELFLDHKAAEKEAGRLSSEWDSVQLKRIKDREEELKEIDENCDTYKLKEKVLDENKKDYERLEARYVVFDTDDFKNKRPMSGFRTQIIDFLP